MAGAAQEVRKSLLKLAQSWPKDPLRPNLDFGEAIRRATETELCGPQARSNVAEARKSLAALERIRSSESLREFPTPRNIIQPVSSSHYYTQLVEAMGRVSRGQSVAPSALQRVRRFFGMSI